MKAHAHKPGFIVSHLSSSVNKSSRLCMRLGGVKTSARETSLPSITLDSLLLLPSLIANERVVVEEEGSK
ncbi:hypothetical protein BHM03_00005610 [Ensete ventricosum]|nr:hypothetical protein BHM03_00005610 [Ensete ventricosum]